MMEVKNPPNIRVTAFIDGFNLYHAIDKLGRDHLKWINLRRLMEIFIQPDTHVLTSVYLFTATPEWLVEPAKRHKAFIQAQAASWCPTPRDVAQTRGRARPNRRG